MDSANAEERFARLLDQLDDGRVGPWQYQMERDQPVIVLEETEDEYVVAFDMTAYETDTVSAHVEDRTLVLTADRFEADRGGCLAAPADPSSDRLGSRAQRRHTTLETVAFPVPVEQTTFDLTVTDAVATVTLQKADREDQQPSAS